MDSNLQFLQELKEDELCELVILPLLEALDYEEIRYIHGTLELGKDIVGKKEDLIDGEVYTGFVVKSKKVDGSVSSNRSLREILFQIKQAISSPFISPFDGKDIHLNKIYFISPFPISQNSILSVKGDLDYREKDVAFIDGSKLLTLLNKHIPDLITSIPNSENRYMRMLFQKFSKNLAITRLGSNKDFSLEEIYIPTKLTEVTKEEAKFITLASPEVTDGMGFQSIFDKNKFLVILADAGAGKSTLMHNALVRFSANYEQLKGKSVIPVFVELSKVPFKKIASFFEFKIWVENYVKDTFNFEGLKWDRLENHILLLDGFDEIKSHHSDLLEYLIELKRVFPQGIIMTSRPSRIPELGEEFKYYKLNPFSDSDILKFLAFWFDDDNKTRELYDFILSDNVLLNFCRTPLILTLFSILGTRERTENLPNRRTDIYDKIIELLIDKWDSIRQIKAEIDPQTKHFILEKLAYATHSKGNKFFTNQEIVKTAKTHFTDKTESHTKLIDELIFRSSLIRKVDESHFSFVHLSFQEFFSAKHLIRFHDDKKVNSILFKQWWINTMKFYFGLLKSLDTLRVSEKRSKYSSHVLIEYLNETSFTSASKKEQVLEFFGKQILLSGYQDRNTLKVFTENYDVIIPRLIATLSQKKDKGLNYTFFKLISLLGRDGVKYIDLERYDLEPHLIPEVQEFIFNFINSRDDRAFEIYQDAFKRIERGFKYRRNNSNNDILLENIIVQKRNVKNSKLEKKIKEQLEKIITEHGEKMKRTVKNAM